MTGANEDGCDSGGNDDRVADLEREMADRRAPLTSATNRDLPLLMGTIRTMAGMDIESIDELPAAGCEFNARLERIDERLAAVERRLERFGDLGQEPTSKEEKFAAILAFGENKRTGSPKVSLSP